MAKDKFKRVYDDYVKVSKKQIESSERIVTNLVDFLLKKGYSRKKIDKIIEGKN